MAMRFSKSSLSGVQKCYLSGFKSKTSKRIRTIALELLIHSFMSSQVLLNSSSKHSNLYKTNSNSRELNYGIISRFALVKFT